MGSCGEWDSQEGVGQHSDSQLSFITVYSFEMTHSFQSQHCLDIISNSPKHGLLPFFKIQIQHNELLKIKPTPLLYEQTFFPKSV